MSTTEAPAASSTAPGNPRGRGRADTILVLFTLGVLLVSAQSDLAGTDTDYPVVLGLVAASWLPLLVRHRWPLAVLLVVVVVECVRLDTVPLVPPVQFNSAPVAVMLAAYEVGVRRPRRVAWLACAIAAPVVLVAGELTRASDLLAANIFALDLIVAATGAGVVVRSRRQRMLALEQRAAAAELDQEAEARRQVAAERFRMARELHDVVAHHLTLVNAQAGVAEYLVLTDQDAAVQALRGIKENTRLALDELRATVGLLRQYDAEPAGAVGDDLALRPMPSLASLPKLVQDHLAAGTEVTCTTVGQPHQLPSVSDLAAYRIIQESLTNARKHAPGAPVRVHLEWRASSLQVVVTNASPPGGPVAAGPGTGHGLVGMRERAATVGGRLDTTREPDGGFRVHAVIPFDSGPTSDPHTDTDTNTDTDTEGESAS